MTNQKLNLARKWRSQNFDQIVGQDLCVRMLKNSLYLGHYFPVYLFLGQRGCGKTSTARIFATAVNCQNLEKFRTNPREYAFPCLECASCLAMKAGKHPDFIEMDAASNTGVDNIRTIIEASTFMPLMGNKKIYLIDEAHMLSKAAFNAFLKILEEPPMSVIFILATTDPEKIIETVKSRCFQLLFKPINSQQLIDHLQHICLVETIAHDRAGLELIVKESDGSARDALNMLEQVRFSSNAVTLLSVSQVLGHVDDRHIFALLKAIFLGSPKEVITAINDIEFGASSLDFLFKRLIEVVRGMLWHKYGIKNAQWAIYDAQFAYFSKHCSALLFHQFLYTMHKEYGIFIKTTAQHAFLEMICVGMAQRNRGGMDSSGGASPLPTPLSAVVQEFEEQDEDEAQDDNEQSEKQEFSTKFKRVVADVVSKVDNPLLTTVLQQGIVQQDQEGLVISFPKDLQFFSDVVEAYKGVIQASIKEHFGLEKNFKALFLHEAIVVQKPLIKEEGAAPLKKNEFTHQENNLVKKKSFPEKQSSYKEQLIDVSDKESWKKAHMILEFFPGRITEIREHTNEQQA